MTFLKRLERMDSPQTNRLAAAKRTTPTDRRAQALKVIIPSIKRPGTNLRDELPAISGASKRNAHEEEAG